MTGVTQKIRRFTGGISDQPDEQKLPGQVRDAVNCTPDVVYGLLKRPGTNLIDWADDVTSDGKWFWINKRNPATGEERYVGQISLESGQVRIWNLFDGREQRVEYKDNIRVNRDFSGAVAVSSRNNNGNEPYFQTETPNDVEDLQVLTVNDVTYVTNRKIAVSMSANIAEKREPEGFYELRTLAGSTTYNLRCYAVVAGTPRVDSIALSATFGDLSTLTFTDNQYTKDFSLKVDDDDDDEEPLTGRIVVTRYTDPEGKQFFSEQVVLTDPGSAEREQGDILQVTEGAVTWDIEIESVSKNNTRGGEIVNATYTTPASGVVAATILNDLATDLRGAGFTAEVIGNGIYFTREEPFSVETNSGSLSRLLGPTSYEIDGETFYVATATNVTELPTQCKEGLVALVSNTIDTTLDDTYRQFEGDNFVDGPGVWAEVARPGQPNEFNPSTMPHLIVRSAEVIPEDPSLRTFWVGSGRWVPREVGDEDTAKRPSFAPLPDSTFGRPINNMVFYKSRLVFLTDESVVLSRVDEPFDFWFKSAETSSPGDRIDLDVSNDFPSVLYAAIENNTGLVLFSENNQYLLSNGDTGALTPSTAQIGRLSTYNFNPDSNPVSLGTTTGFVGRQGKYTRFYEMAAIQREGEPSVVEQSKVVERLLPQSMNLVGISKENDMVALGKRGEKDIWLFRYFDTGEQRQQSSWFKWQFHGTLVSHVIFFDSYYLVLENEGKTSLVRADLRILGRPTTTFTFDTEDYKTIEGDSYRFFLEYSKRLTGGSTQTKTSVRKGVATTTVDKTIFNISNYPVFNDIRDKLIVLDLNVEETADGTYQGNILVPKISADNTTITLPGKFPQGIALGYDFEMKIVMPQFYITKTVNQNATESLDTANFIVHRVKTNLGQVGYYETTLKRLGRDDYTQVYEAKPMDLYHANELGWMPDYEQTTPIYQRNNTFNLIIKSEHPSPAALYSATLEGVYTENYYKRA